MELESAISPNLAGSSLREGSSYDYDDFQYVQADLAVDENYGILANEV